MNILSNENVKRRLSNVVKVVKQGCVIAGPILATIMLNESAKRTLNEVRYIGNIEYDDVVKAILNSDMLSSYKQEIIAMLKMNQDSEFYKTVIHVVQSSMLSSDKVKMIQNISSKVE